jgi:hypothetical protein
MNSLYLIIFFLILAAFYLYTSSYNFQFFINKRRRKKDIIDNLVQKVKGKYLPEGYFAVSHKVLTTSEYKHLPSRFKLNFAKCYNIIKFKTPDAQWELFFYLIKEGNFKYSEIFTIRVFPKNHINSEGQVEKNYSRLNIFTNNRYLTKELEEPQTQEYLNWLLRKNGDILLISENNLQYKIFISKKKMTSERVFNIIKALNEIKNRIYKKDVIEY